MKASELQNTVVVATENVWQWIGESANITHSLIEHERKKIVNNL